MKKQITAKVPICPDSICIGIYRKYGRIFILTLFIVGLALWLRLYKIGLHSYRSEEIIRVVIASEDLKASITSDVFRSYFFQLLLHLWIRIFSNSEFATRVLSALFGAFAIIPLYFLVKLLADKKTAILVLYLSAISPFYILFSRLAEDIGLWLFLIALSLLFFLVYCKENKGLIAYVISTILMLYSGPLGFLILGAEWIFLLRWYRQGRFKKWLIAQSFILFGYSAWLVRFCSGFSAESAGIDRMPTSFFNKIAYLFFTFSLGETVSPWNWKIVCPFAIIIMALLSRGILNLRLKQKCVSFIYTFFLISLASLFTSRGSPEYCICASIMFYIVLALGLEKLKMPLFLSGIGIITLFNSYSLYNLYTDKEYNIQSFTDKWREVADFVYKLSDKKTRVIASHPSFIWYYNAENLLIFDCEKYWDTLKEIDGAKKIILVKTPLSCPFYPKDKRLYRFENWIEKRFALTQTIGFCENENYRIKRRLLKRAFPQFRIQILVYELNI